jgi:tRNA 2-thiouridine synthesizing protein D
MSKFALFVTKSPFDSRNAESAHQFCVAAIALGHQIQQVFFYQTGVHNASALLSVNSDEVDMMQRWQNLKQSHGVSLCVCVTAATRRGVINECDATETNAANAHASFEIVGMSEYFAALHDESIKSIQF